MSDHWSLIEELEDALPSRTMADRATALRRVLDLFLFGAAPHAPAEIAVFDDVMVRLAAEIEVSMRAELARRLATIPNVPPKLIRILAADPDITVAGPVLRGSPQLDDEALVIEARRAAQDHLLAISQRVVVNPPVTDELVDRGDRTVALALVENAGARFSEHGHTVLVDRSRDDDELAAGMWRRADVPHHQLVRLITIASDRVRAALETLDRQRINLIRNTVVEVANDLQNRLRAQARDYGTVHRMVAALHENRALDDAKVRALAESGQFEATTLALSMLCDLPIGTCERAMVQDRTELIMLLVRAVGLSWETARAMLQLRAEGTGTPAPDVDSEVRVFSRIRPETARKALQFVRMRERAAMSKESRLLSETRD